MRLSRERQPAVKVSLLAKPRIAAAVTLIAVPAIGGLLMFSNGANGVPDSRYTEGSSAYADSNPSWYRSQNLCANPAAQNMCDNTPWLRVPAKGAKTMTLEQVKAQVLQGHPDNKVTSARLERYSATGGNMSTVDPERPVWVVEADGPPLFKPSIRPAGPGEPSTTMPPYAPHNKIVMDALSGYPLAQEVG